LRLNMCLCVDVEGLPSSVGRGQFSRSKRNTVNARQSLDSGYNSAKQVGLTVTSNYFLV